MDNQNLSENFSGLFSDLKKYLEIRYRYAKLDATEKLAITSSFIVVLFILLFIVTVFLFFISFALAYYLGQVWQQTHLGFIGVAAIYFVLAIILILLRKPLIVNPVQRHIVKLMYKYERETSK